MQIIKKSVKELIPYARNSRTHGDEQISQIMASITEFGFTNPILIDEKNEIIAGHGRLVASQRLKLENVPCIVLSGLTEAQKKAYVIADNKIAINAGWDEDLLKLELIELDEIGFDYSELGFDFEFDLEDNEPEKIDITPVEIKPYKMYHILISVPYKSSLKLQEIFNSIDFSKIEGVEIEKQSN